MYAVKKHVFFQERNTHTHNLLNINKVGKWKAKLKPKNENTKKQSYQNNTQKNWFWLWNNNYAYSAFEFFLKKHPSSNLREV